MLKSLFRAFSNFRQVTIYHSPTSPASQEALALLRAAQNTPLPADPSRRLAFTLDVAAHELPDADALARIAQYARVPPHALLLPHAYAATAGAVPPGEEGILVRAARTPDAVRWPVVVDWNGACAALGSVAQVEELLDAMRRDAAAPKERYVGLGKEQWASISPWAMAKALVRAFGDFVTIYHSPASPDSVAALALLRSALSAYPAPHSPPLRFDLSLSPTPPSEDELRLIASYARAPLSRFVHLPGLPPGHAAAPGTAPALAALCAAHPAAFRWPVVVDWNAGRAVVGAAAGAEGVRGLLEEMRRERDGEAAKAGAGK